MVVTLEVLQATPVVALDGVSAKMEAELAKLGIESVLDLLEHFPRRYHDRRNRASIAELQVGQEATVVAEVVRSQEHRRGRNVRVEVAVTDGQAMLSLTFFGQGWRIRQLTPGTEASFFGKVDRFQHKLQMVNPVVDVIGPEGEAHNQSTGVIVPIYPESGKADVATWQLRRFIAEARERFPDIDDPLPADLRARAKVMNRADAYRGIHQPENERDHYQARRRLVLDEFLRIQLELVQRKRIAETTERGIAHQVSGALVDEFLASLPFALTAGQHGALSDIASDMGGPHPMHRLLQGDVGSGKTVVAVAALLMAVQSGHQGALLAPTEVLAEQHHRSVTALLGDLVVPAPVGEGSLFSARPLQVRLLTNRTTPKGRQQLLADLDAGAVDVVVGTHALLEPDIGFRSLGLVVVDEQHRFGVEQRTALLDKGHHPDELVMTATPIPRSAAMLVYGHLEHTEMRDMPVGRTPITTIWCQDADERAVAYERVRAEVAAGRQAYVVCPLVDPSTSGAGSRGDGAAEVKSALEERDRLAEEELKGLTIEVLHGKMRPADKERVMAAFRSGEIAVLVATTVIEVGVDVPNATVMIIESADRFGLSQLHQLRGRVGRGGGASWCHLFAEPTTEDGLRRMEAMVASTDGFHLAEVDLDLRGGGQIFGERQHGRSDLKLGRIPRDEKAVAFARKEAEGLLDADPTLARHPALRAEVAWYLSTLERDDVDFAKVFRS